MGLVYRAEDLKLGRPVALKFLHEELVGDLAALTRFERESRAASALHHPNICSIFGVEEWQGRPIIAMELVEGETLRLRAHEGHLTPSFTMGAKLSPGAGLAARGSQDETKRLITGCVIVLASILDYYRHRLTSSR